MGEFQDHVDGAKAKGLLAKKLYVIISTTADDALFKEHFAEHLAYQKKLEADGVLFAAGPLADDEEDGMGGESLIIYRAENLGQARQYAENDPMHKSGAKTLRVRPWLVNEGGFTLKVTYSNGGRELI